MPVGAALPAAAASFKIEIPRLGDHGIDLRDELELNKVPGA
jgi:hypothetical protein